MKSLVEQYGTHTTVNSDIHCKRPYTVELWREIRITVSIDPGI